METLESKLARFYKLDKEQAKALVEAGLEYPHKIKQAKKSDLEKVVGKAKADQMRPEKK